MLWITKGFVSANVLAHNVQVNRIRDVESPIVCDKEEKEKARGRRKNCQSHRNNTTDKKWEIGKTEGLLLDWHPLVCDIGKIVSTPLFGNCVKGKVLTLSGTIIQM